MGVAAATILTLLAFGFTAAEGAKRESCVDDAMIVFDGSGP